MKHTLVSWALGAAALTYAVQAVLCAVVWERFGQLDTLEPGERITLAPFPGGYDTLRVLWFVGLGLAGLSLVLVSFSFRFLLAVLSVASGAAAAGALWFTVARPGLGVHEVNVFGTSGGFPYATILYVVAVGLAGLGVLLSRSEPAF
ncbi:ABC-type multidrug transport system permease subunit [Marmoricola sp. OAE513]|uniref:hypothetical protein n=1 Tax=Marmoricola sp. OAE513 TaxID=2817894 RepID=UPI001AE29654